MTDYEVVRDDQRRTETRRVVLLLTDAPPRLQYAEYPWRPLTLEIDYAREDDGPWTVCRVDLTGTTILKSGEPGKRAITDRIRNFKADRAEFERQVAKQRDRDLFHMPDYVVDAVRQFFPDPDPPGGD